MIRVLIVDDSPTARAALRLALSTSPDVAVIGEAANGEQALQMCHKRSPDIITMDVFLRRESGLEVARSIMTETPRPIVVVTGVNPGDPQLAYRALNAGALEVVAKLPAPEHPAYNASRDRFIRLLQTLAAVPVVHRFGQKGTAKPKSNSRMEPPIASPSQYQGLVILGASTGGPPLLAKILTQLPAPYPTPIVLVQHITQGFSRGFAKWLADVTPHRTVVVDHHVELENSVVYVATDDKHLVFAPGGRAGPFTPPGGERGPVPGIDMAFHSAAERYGPAVIAGLLTGMGRDGANGLLQLRKAGARTFAQLPQTCAVSSMPDSAIAINAAQRTLAPEQIVSFLSSPGRATTPTHTNK